MHYIYNGKGERVRRYLGTDDVTTVYDEAGRWLGDYDGTGTPIQQTIWLDARAAAHGAAGWAADQPDLPANPAGCGKLGLFFQAGVSAS